FRNVRRHRWLRAKKVRRVEPGLRDRGLIGAALYYDAQTDDARLVIATIRSAARAGALVANYVETTALLKPDGRVRGAVVRDVLTGQTASVRAHVVVNATGPWADMMRRLDDPRGAPLLRPTKGAHVIVPRRRMGNEHAVTLLSQIDGRVMFVLPWSDFAYIGTTDTDRKSTRLNSSHVANSYAVFCLKQKSSCAYYRITGGTRHRAEILSALVAA